MKFSKPSPRKGSGILQFRKRVPIKLKDKANGKHIRFIVPAKGGLEKWEVNRRVDDYVAFSYDSKVPAVIEVRQYIANQKFLEFCNSLKVDTGGLDESMVRLYARHVYELTKVEGYDSTGLPSLQKTHACLLNMFSDRRWKLEPIFRKWHHQASEFDLVYEILPNTFSTSDLSFEAMNHRVGFLVNWWLCENDLTVSISDRIRLVEATDRFAREVYAGIAVSISNGQTRIDPNRIFAAKTAKKYTISEIFDHYANNVEQEIDSIKKWTNVKDKLISFLGHEIAEDVEALDLIRWRTHLEKSGRAMNTINGMDLIATRRIFSYGLEIQVIKTNPAKGLKDSTRAKQLPPKEPYTNEEVVAILSAAKMNTDPALRWIPQLAASVGTRVSEVAQIHASQINVDDKSVSIWVVKFAKTEKGQKLKTEQSMRFVPLDPVLFGNEFLDFVRTRKGKFLFSDLVYDEINPNRRLFRSATDRSRNWIRTLGIDHSSKSPYHAFRHWFKVRALQLRLDPDLIRYIQGHTRE